MRIRQIVLNLVSNAVKFTEKGSVSVIVSSRNQELKNSKLNLIIQVVDTGIGIAEDNLEIIFDRFRQVDGQSIRKYGGTGLGLAISKRLTKLMDGVISVKSRVGEGTTFTVELNNVEIAN